MRAAGSDFLEAALSSENGICFTNSTAAEYTMREDGYVERERDVGVTRYILGPVRVC